MVKYTIQSISEEGVYFLVNGWSKHRAIWVTKDKIKPSILFSMPQYAQASLTRLLKVMPEYAYDKFEIVEIAV